MASGDKNISSDKIIWAAFAGSLIAGIAAYRSLTKYDLAGKVVVITGGSRGLGLALAREAGRKGARLAICARTVRQLEAAKSELSDAGMQVISIAADLTEKEQVEAMVERVVQHYGSIDVLINNAGIIHVGPEESMSIKDYEEAMDLNFWAAFYGIHSVLPFFLKQGGGRVVNITSIGGKLAVPHLLPYTASKFALVGLSEGMHAELKKKNIIVTTVVPNLMRTGSPRNAIVKGDYEKEYALFKISDSNPLLSQSVELAAKNIVRALEYGESEVVLSLTAKLATAVKGIAPSLINFLFATLNHFLPEPKSKSKVPKKGFEVESELSHRSISAMSDKAAH